MCKVGGYFVTSLRKHYWVDDHELGYKEKMAQLVMDGKFELQKTWTFMRGHNDHPDPLFKQIESLMFVCRRLA